MNNFHFGAVSSLRMAKLNPKLIKLLELAITRTPVDFGIAWMGGYRTAEQQYELFNKVPKVTTKDGFKNKSAHQSGMAVDIMPYIGSNPTPTKENYTKVRKCLEDCATELGLKYKPVIKWDLPHFELIS